MFRVTAVIACTLLLWISTSEGADGIIDRFADTIKANTKPAFKTCQSETGVTKSDLESLKKRKIPETKTGRCFVQCLFNSVKLMDDGKFSKQGMVLAFSAAMGGDLSKISKLRKLSEVCEREIGGKRYSNCQGVNKIVECVARNGQAYGIEFPKEKKV